MCRVGFRYNGSMTDILIRPAELGDFERVTTLLAELGRPPVTPQTVEAVRALYERHVGRTDTASLVAERGGELLGFMSLEIRDHLNHVRPQGWIPDLIVTESARGLGAARLLLTRGFDLARERGCDRVRLESGYARTVAHQVYLALGMSNDGYYFTRSL